MNTEPIRQGLLQYVALLQSAGPLDVARLEQGVDDIVFELRAIALDGGCEAARRIRAGESGPRRLQILGMTAFGHTWAAEAIAAGCDAFVPKPMGLEELELSVRLLLPQLHDGMKRARTS